MVIYDAAIIQIILTIEVVLDCIFKIYLYLCYLTFPYLVYL